MAYIKRNVFIREFLKRFNLDFSLIKKFKQYEWEFYADSYNLSIEDFKEKLYAPYVPVKKQKKKPKRGRGGIMRPMEYYETTPAVRTGFKSICFRRGWNFDDFIETPSEEKCFTSRKYFYKKK